MRPSYHALSADDQAGFEGLHALYRSALPESEQKSRAQLSAMLETPGYLFLCAVREQRLLGFAIVYVCQGAPLALLEYLAVAESERRSGLGTSLFERGAQHAGERIFVLEMDAPSPAEPFSMRRSSFYRRQGCKRVDGLDYIMPLPDKAPPPMWLLTLATQAELPRQELESWLRTLYSEVYGCAPTDPRITRMLAPLPQTVRLVALPDDG